MKKSFLIVAAMALMSIGIAKAERASVEEQEPILTALF